jgi:hypothetical protein
MNNKIIENPVAAKISAPAERPCGSKKIAISDEKLYQLCQTYGERTRFWRQKFAGLLPEVFKRKLYEKKGFSSIFEFAKKLAGLSEEQVRLVLNLERRFEETPDLKSLLVEGKVSVNKLARIVSIARPENEEFLAAQVQILSKSAVETLVRDEKFAEKNYEQNGLQKSFFVDKSLPGQTLNLSSEVRQKLSELQQKGVDINNLLLEFLQKREQEIAKRKEEISNQIVARENEKRSTEKPITRHIPTIAKKILTQEFGKKCSIKNCQKDAVEIHHLQRFCLSQSHDPRYLAPLCKEHHELSHSADLAYHRMKHNIL